MKIEELPIVSSQIELLSLVCEGKVKSNNSFISPFWGLNAKRNGERVACLKNTLLSDDDLDKLHKAKRISDEDHKQKRPFYLRSIV